MGIGDRYVYTMEGIGEKARNHGLLVKSVVSFFFAFSGYSAATQPTWQIDFWPKKEQKQGYSLIGTSKNSKFVTRSSKKKDM